MSPGPLWVCPDRDCSRFVAMEEFAAGRPWNLRPCDPAGFTVEGRAYRVSLVIAAGGWRWAVFADEGEVPP